MSYYPKTLLDLFGQYPVFESLCSFLGIAEIQSLIRTCIGLSNIYKDMLRLRTQWNIDTQLRRFINDPYEFRSQLGKYNALVSGDVALQFFDRTVWEGNCLEVFVDATGGSAFSRYLCNNEDYQIGPEMRWEDYDRIPWGTFYCEVPLNTLTWGLQGCIANIVDGRI